MQQKPNLYPLLFQEVYKTKLWGGDKIYQYKGKEAPEKHIGETWEVSPIEGSASVIANGPLRGKTLIDITTEYGSSLLGDEVYRHFGGAFPLLVKLIHSEQDLSVQVHPSNDFAQKLEQASGKCEMWYLLHHTPEAVIHMGWKNAMTPDQLRGLLTTDTLMQYIENYPSKVGDTYYIPPGTVHTIGAGNLLLEIQQASDITYRLYDFNRVDDTGKKRELHVDKALEVINYLPDHSGPIPYDTTIQDSPITLIQCPYFTTRLLQLTKEYHLDATHRHSFTLLFIEKGTLILNDELKLTQGQTVLLPACLHHTTLTPSPTAKVIETYIEPQE